MIKSFLIDLAQILRFKKNKSVILFFGKTGVGKSSTINALFDLNCKIDHAVACTKKPQFRDIKLSKYKGCVSQQIRVVDLPGIGESLTGDQKYMSFYKKWMCQADVLVWVTQADTRAYKQDEIFLKNLVPFFKSSLFLIVAINKIDCLQHFNDNNNQFYLKTGDSSVEYIRLINEKIDDIYNVFKNVLNNKVIFEKDQVIPYTSVYGWGLENLKGKTLRER